MFTDVGNVKKPTPINEYTMAMALSDAEAYYQAGTITSALIGLSKTAARADDNPALAKAAAGPNPSQVTAAQETAAPTSGGAVQPPPSIVIKPNWQVPVITLPPAAIGAISPREKKLGPDFPTKIQNLLCVSGTAGTYDGPTRDAIRAFFAGVDGAAWDTAHGTIVSGSGDEHPYLATSGMTRGDALTLGVKAPNVLAGALNWEAAKISRVRSWMTGAVNLGASYNSMIQ